MSALFCSSTSCIWKLLFIVFHSHSWEKEWGRRGNGTSSGFCGWPRRASEQMLGELAFRMPRLWLDYFRELWVFKKQLRISSHCLSSLFPLLQLYELQKVVENRIKRYLYWYEIQNASIQGVFKKFMEMCNMQKLCMDYTNFCTKNFNSILSQTLWSNFVLFNESSAFWEGSCIEHWVPVT